MTASAQTTGINGGKLFIDDHHPLQQDRLLTAEIPACSEENAHALLADTVTKINADIAALPAADVAGSTGSIVITMGDGKKAVVAQVGDSPVIFYAHNPETGEITALDVTHDHSPLGERERIEQAGGHVFEDSKGTWRLNGELAVARSFGDRHVGNGYSSEPDIYTVDLQDLAARHPGCTLYAVVGCDGLTEFGKRADEYAPCFTSASDESAIAQSMVNRALQLGMEKGYVYSDNISVAVAQLPPPDGTSHVLAVMDGHNQPGETGGEIVAQAVQSSIGQTLEMRFAQRYSEGPPPTVIDGKTAYETYKAAKRASAPSSSGQRSAAPPAWDWNTPIDISNVTDFIYHSSAQIIDNTDGSREFLVTVPADFSRTFLAGIMDGDPRTLIEEGKSLTPSMKTLYLPLASLKADIASYLGYDVGAASVLNSPTR